MSPAAPLKDLNMADYVPALRNAAVVRMVKQLSDVYSTMRIEALSKVGCWGNVGYREWWVGVVGR